MLIRSSCGWIYWASPERRGGRPPRVSGARGLLGWFVPLCEQRTQPRQLALGLLGAAKGDSRFLAGLGRLLTGLGRFFPGFAEVALEVLLALSSKGELVLEVGGEGEEVALEPEAHPAVEEAHLQIQLGERKAAVLVGQDRD